MKKHNERSSGYWIILVILFFSIALFSYSILWKYFKTPSLFLGVKIFLIVVPFIFLFFMIWIRSLYYNKKLLFINQLLEKHSKTIDNLSASKIWFWILLSSILSLFMELMLIRLHASFFQLFAFYKNISLLSCFLGLGIGFARSSKKPLLTPLLMPLISLMIIFMYVLKHTPLEWILQNPVSEQLSMGLGSTPNISSFLITYGFIIFIFILNTLCFIPLGHLISRLMSRQDKLLAYSWNLTGSLLGIILFSLICYLWAPPLIWIIVTSLMLIFMLRQTIATILPTILITLLLLCLFTFPIKIDQKEIYSPYQILTATFRNQIYPEIKVNNVYFQHIWNIIPNKKSDQDKNQHWFEHYSIPYLFKAKPKEVLVVGSGTGNDIASALYHQAGHIDGVEIDPAIMNMGKLFHPGKPYLHPNVTPIINDARAYIQHTKKKYDLIIYGLLDSHTLLSGLSSVRLDSYVYTVEAFQEARACLKKDGMISLSFYVLNPRLGRKLFLMLQEAFDGQTPFVYQVAKSKRYTFIIGENLVKSKLPNFPDFVDITETMKDPLLKADQSTDNWPFFYMPVKKYPLSYILVLSGLFIVSLLLIFSLMHGEGSGYSWTCFFLGAGFMLLETKAITELALLFGSTWFVNSIVIAAILVMAFLSNLLVMKKGVILPLLTYLLLAGSLLLGLFFTHGQMTGLSPWLKTIFMPILLTLPIFFSGFAFSSELKKAKTISIALSSNLLGAMLGGILEYNSMYFGFRFLYILALFMYGLAFISSYFPLLKK